MRIIYPLSLFSWSRWALALLAVILLGSADAAPDRGFRPTPPFRVVTVEVLTTINALNTLIPAKAKGVGFYYPLRARPRLPGLNNLYLNVYQQDEHYFLTTALLAVPGLSIPSGAKIVAAQLEINGKRNFLPPRGRNETLSPQAGIYRNFKISWAQIQTLADAGASRLHIFTTAGPRRAAVAPTCQPGHSTARGPKLPPAPKSIDSFCDKLRYALATGYLTPPE